jgi:integrase
MRRGGFESRDDAVEARDKARATMRKGVDPSVKITTGDYLAKWMAGRRDLKPTTRHNYENSIVTYLIPLLGHIDLARLQPEHIADAFAAIREWNDLLEAGRPVRKFQRHVGPAAMQRIRNVLQAALRDAIKARMIEFNAAKLVSMDPVTQHKPTIWTKERARKFRAGYEEALKRSPLTRGDRAFLVWRSMALRPSPVMVWNLTDTGAFLDYASGHRMMPIFELAAGTGLRRGELCGLRWTDVDLDAGSVSVTPGGVRVQAGWDVVEGGPKTEGSGRDVSLVAQDVATLKAWKRKQSAERLEWGQDWAGGSLVFTQEDGTPWHPDTVTDTFERLAFAAHLPPVRLHDMRHAHISELFAAGIDARIISERVGHMGSKMTRDYAAVAAEVSRAAAEKVVGMIPRSARQ